MWEHAKKCSVEKKKWEQVTERCSHAHFFQAYLSCQNCVLRSSWSLSRNVFFLSWFSSTFMAHKQEGKFKKCCSTHSLKNQSHWKFFCSCFQFQHVSVGQAFKPLKEIAISSNSPCKDILLTCSIIRMQQQIICNSW